MKKILDYSEVLKVNGHQDRGEQAQGSTELFFERSQNTCPFCKIETERVHEDAQNIYPDWLDGGLFSAREHVMQCKKCGWWRLRCDKLTTGEIEAQSVEVSSAILKSYDLSSKEIPIDILRDYLRTHSEDVIHIHDGRMERLVQSVFREHFSCDVEHVGKSHDGGIDLILINADSPTVVQVKRRKSLDHIESVSGIREFLGATILGKSKNCIYVSTSGKFSEPAIKAANNAVQLGAVESYELYDFDRFFDVLNLSTPKQIPWQRHLRSLW
jgi:restriction system protein